MLSDPSILGDDGAVGPKHAKFVHLHLMIMAISHTPPSLLSPNPSHSTSLSDDGSSGDRANALSDLNRYSSDNGDDDDSDDDRSPLRSLSSVSHDEVCL